MQNQNFTASFVVDQSPKEVFDAINNVRAWWIDEIEGDSQKVGDEFAVRFWDVHYSNQKITEMVPGAKVVWLVTDSKLTFTKKEDEWTGTHVIFEIEKQGDKTLVRFTHDGLVPAFECFDGCSKGWTSYFSNSLHKLITTGKGVPHIKKSEVKAKEKA